MSRKLEFCCLQYVQLQSRSYVLLNHKNCLIFQLFCLVIETIDLYPSCTCALIGWVKVYLKRISNQKAEKVYKKWHIFVNCNLKLQLADQNYNFFDQKYYYYGQFFLNENPHLMLLVFVGIVTQILQKLH